MTTDASSGGARPGWLRWAIGLLAVVVLVVVAVILLSLSLQRGQDGVLAGVAVDGVDVSGASRGELSQVVADRADERGGEPVVIEGEREEVRASRSEVGAGYDEDATIEDAWSRGRRGVVASLRDHLAARRGARVDVALTEELDESAVRAFAVDAAQRLSVPPRDAAVELVADGDETRVEVTEAVVGEEVDGDALADDLEEALEETRGAARVSALGEPLDPEVGDSDVAEVRTDAERAISDAVVLRNPGGGADVELTAPQIADVLEVEIDPEAEDGPRAALIASPQRLDARLDRSAVDVEASEASIAVEGDEVVISGGETGFTVDLDASAPRVVDAALSDAREAELAGDVVEPDFSREDAEDLGIVEEVASFTTEHPPGQPRVQNIQLFADIIEGSIIRPGETFSLNQAAGPRTEERGFVADGVIIDGELEDRVGGGVSQYATTFFNAAWFAGIQIDEHQPHSFYIARYPEGRESTISFGTIDVVITNDSPHGILVSHASSSTSITVRFFSTPWAEVDTFTSERRNIEPGEVTDGFTVDYGRTITYPDSETREESYTWTYEPNDGEDADE